MTDAVEKALSSVGASKTDLDEGQGIGGAPLAPADTGLTKPDIKEGKDEVFDDGTKEAKPEPKKEEAKKEDPVVPVPDFVSMNDPAADGAMAVLKEAGVSPAEAEAFFLKAAKSGQLTDIDWPTIEAKIGTAKTFLVKSGVETYYNNKQKVVQETVAQTHTIFGGVQNFDTVKAWAQEREQTDKAFGKQVDTIRGLLNEGGERAALGARELLRLYNSDGGTKGLGATKLATGTSTGNVIGTPLTRAEYVTAMEKAHDTGGNPAVIAALQQRRLAGRNAGI
jgi:hypothetical protein